MTENEAIKHLQSYAEVVDNIIKYCKDFEPKADITGYLEKKTVFAMAISAIKEVQQYRKIGTVEECRETVEKLHTEKDGCVIVNKENMIQIIKVLAAGKVLDFKVDSRCAEGYVQAMKDIIEIFEKGGIE